MLAKIVCFDLGGVLIRICPTWDEALEVSGIEPKEPKAEYGRLEAFSGLVAYQAGEMTLDEYLVSLGEWLGGLEREQSLAVHSSVLREPYTGALELLDDIERLEMAHGCMSNTNEAHWQEMAAGRFKVFERLGTRLGSHQVGFNKPSPGIYQAFENASGCSGSEVIYFDDTPVNVDAGLKRGWRAHLVNPMGDPIEQMRSAISEQS